MWKIVGILIIINLTIVIHYFINNGSKEQMEHPYYGSGELKYVYLIPLVTSSIINCFFAISMLIRGIVESSPLVLLSLFPLGLGVMSMVTLIYKEGSVLILKRYIDNRKDRKVV